MLIQIPENLKLTKKFSGVRGQKVVQVLWSQDSKIGYLM